MPRGNDSDFVKTRVKGYVFKRAACKSPTVIYSILTLRYNSDEEVHLFCSSMHDATSCSSQLMTLEEKKARLSREGRCFCCLMQGHLARQCKRKIVCQHCARRHASSMCIQLYHRYEVNEPVTPTPVQWMSIHERSVVLLPLLTVKVSGSTRPSNCRILLDGGSQRSFIKTDVSRKLGCELVGQETHTVGVFGGKETPETLNRMCVYMRSLTTNSTVLIEALEVDSICHQLLPFPEETVFGALQDKLIDTRSLVSQYTEHNSIVVILGADFNWDVVTGNIQSLGSTLKPIETRLGWTVQGLQHEPKRVVHCSNVVALHVCSEQSDATSTMKQFLEQESTSIKNDALAHRDDCVIPEFSKDTSIKDGRYEVALHFRNDIGFTANLQSAEKNLNHFNDPTASEWTSSRLTMWTGRKETL